jgi:hypothetical protein
MATTPRSELAHAEHVTVEAWHQDCLEDECEAHHDEHGSRIEDCPPIDFTVCVDCMDDKGAGREEEGWDDWPLEAWPHPGSVGWTETPPAIFKESDV